MCDMLAHGGTWVTWVTCWHALAQARESQASHEVHASTWVIWFTPWHMSHMIHTLAHDSQAGTRVTLEHMSHMIHTLEHTWDTYLEWFWSSSTCTAGQSRGFEAGQPALRASQGLLKQFSLHCWPVNMFWSSSSCCAGQSRGFEAVKPALRASQGVLKQLSLHCGPVKGFWSVKPAGLEPSDEIAALGWCCFLPWWHSWVF